MTVTFETRYYEFAHGRKPRGTGFWFFSPMKNPDFQKDDPYFSTCGNYAEAKAKAKEWAKENGYTMLYTLS